MAAAAAASSASLKAANEGSSRYLTSYCAPRRAEKGRGICYCVLAYSPNDFYVVTEADMIQNLHFTQQMEQLYMQESHFLDESQLTIGTPVAARYVGGDLAWYRAKLVSFDESRGDYSIEFVDYAHSQNNSFDQLRAIPSKIAEYPPMALHCRLYGLEAFDWKREEVSRKFCEIAFKTWNKGKCVVGFLTDKVPYVVRLWNIETGEELLPETLGARRLSSSQQPKPSFTAENCDLLLLSDGGGTGARLKTAPVNNDLCDKSSSNFGFLGEFIKKMKLEMPAEGTGCGGGASMTKLETLRTKSASKTKTGEKGVIFRDAAVQTAGDAASSPLLENENIVDVLKNRLPLLAELLLPASSS